MSSSRPTLSPSGEPPRSPLTVVTCLILFVAALGFAFDTYELLMLPLIVRPALIELLHVDPTTTSGNQTILNWFAAINSASAVAGGVFGLLGGYLTDRLGRRRVLTWSILLYSFSALAAGFSTSVWMLLVFRCTTFIGVCVEFVAAVAWLAELFPNPKQREAVLGYTQACSSLGGMMVAFAFQMANEHAAGLPAIFGEHQAWRYTLMSGLIPAIPLILIRPFLPESPVWAAKRAAGTLRRPSLGELFQPKLARTTWITTAMFACSFAAAFGAVQMAPQIVPRFFPELKGMTALRAEIETKQQANPKDPALKELKAQARKLGTENQTAVAVTQQFQEFGGLAGRVALAAAALWIVSRRALLRMFQVPGLIVMPLAFAVAGAGDNLTAFRWALGLAGFLTIAQFSFWGNYLPRVYPVHLRGTGESFAANVGGRMIGSQANFVTGQVAGWLAAFFPVALCTAYAAAIVGTTAFALGLILSFWLPEPPREELPE